MRALDTNVVVRLVTRDHTEQAERAAEVLSSGRTWLAKTVALETEWVLRSAYELPRDKILAIFRGLLGLPALEVEDRVAVVRALRWYEGGFDFADALHLASLHPGVSFATFDRRLAARASTLEEAPRVELL